MKKVLIVGSTGFVGQNFVNFLSSNSIDFCCLDRKTRGDNESYTWDQLDEIPYQKVTDVFFLTGKAHDLKNASDDQVYFDVNVGLLKKFIASAKLHNYQGQFVYISSVKAVADVVDGVLKEDVDPLPKTVYGKSKLEAEQYLVSSFDQSKSYILRPCMIHGPGNKGNLNQLFDIINKGIPNVLVNFDNSRSLLSIDNLLFVFNQIINEKLKPDTYQVSDTSTLSINDMFRLISETIGKKYKFISVPKFIIKLLAKVGDVLPLPLNTERLQKLTENYIVSNDKLLNALGVNLPTKIDEGLNKTIESFK